MTWEAWTTVGIVVAALVALARNLGPTDGVMMAAATAVALLRIVSERFPSPSDVAGAFGNEALVTVGVLFVVAQGLTQTGGAERLSAPLLGRPRSVGAAQVRLMLPTAAISAFMNNTPLVAMLLPVVKDWSRSVGLDPTKLLIPLSYAAVLGGVTTLIGTSTNFIVQGLMIEAQMTPMTMFTITPVGVAVAAAGILYTIVASRFLLPERKALGERLSDPREYRVELFLEPGSPLDGKSIADAGLRHLPGLFLAELTRGADTYPAVGPEHVLRGGDRLAFVGLVQSVTDLLKTRGLVPATNEDTGETTSPGAPAPPRHDRIFVEAVIGPSSPMVGATVRASRFRNHYGAVIVAVHRDGDLVRQKIGDIVIEPGDTLLLEAAPSFLEQHGESRHFFLVRGVGGAGLVRHDRAPVALLVLAGLVVGAALEPVSGVGVLPIAMAAAAAMILTRCCSMDQARAGIDWGVLISIGAALVLSKALTTSGAAQALGDGVQAIAGPLGPHGALAIVYLATVITTEVVTNNAAAALAFPVGMAVAQGLGVSPTPFAIAVCIAASCGFASPTGYQTHLMVYGAGGYRFADFLRIGLGLDLLCLGVAVVVTPMFFPF